MENKHTGFIMIGISAVMIFIIFLFRNAVKKVVVGSCPGDHGLNCPMYAAIDQQTYLALAIVGVIVIMGLALTFSKPNEKIIVKKIKGRKQRRKIDLKGFRDDEIRVLNLLKNEEIMFQANLIEETGFGKAKMTRILDKLDGRGLIERKRRGLTNVVVLKND